MHISPGQNRPGLIEARWIRTGFLGTIGDLRGKIAPASLKHSRGSELRLHYITSPGQNRPGLIEARSYGHVDGCCWPDLRGKIAPASLKLG